MPVVAIRRPRPAAPRPHPAAVIVSERGRRVPLRYAPVGGQIGGMGWEWKAVDRSGRKPLVLRGGSKLRTLAYTLRLVWPDPDHAVESTIEALRGLADSGERVRMTGMGPQERGLYRIEDMPVTIISRQDGSNAITEAEVALRLVEASDPTTSLGPLTGGAFGPAGRGSPTPAKPVTPGVTKPSAPPPPSTSPSGVENATGLGALFN